MEGWTEGLHASLASIGPEGSPGQAGSLAGRMMPTSPPDGWHGAWSLWIGRSVAPGRGAPGRQQAPPPL